MDIEGLDITAYFMRGVFNYNPPQKAREMPRWSLNHLLKYLRGSQFEPLQLASPTRLIQKTLTLILLSSGRRKSEIANLSRVARAEAGSLHLEWVPGFVPKRHSPNFQPPCPSISPMTSPRESDSLLCPVRAYRIYLGRSREWLSRFPFDLHPIELLLVPRTAIPASAEFLSETFINLVKDSRRAIGGIDALMRDPRVLDGPEVPIGIHQTRKFAAAYAI